MTCKDGMCITYAFKTSVSNTCSSIDMTSFLLVSCTSMRLIDFLMTSRTFCLAVRSPPTALRAKHWGVKSRANKHIPAHAMRLSLFGRKPKHGSSERELAMDEDMKFNRTLMMHESSRDELRLLVSSQIEPLL